MLSISAKFFLVITLTRPHQNLTTCTKPRMNVNTLHGGMLPVKAKEDNGLLPVGVKEPKTEERRLAGGRGAEWEWQRVIGGEGI